MQYDVLVIGAGLSGLTAAGLLAKRGLKVGVLDKNYSPGGSCGVFKRENATFDVGSSMLFGFGDQGFNPHRFVFNCLEEPIRMLKHDLLYCVHYRGQRILFWADLDRFAGELGRVFPSEKGNIQRFYRDLHRMYRHVMVEHPVFATPDEADPRASLKGLLRHPLSYLKFFSFMNRSAHSLLRQYFRDPAIFHFFDKLTSTYCYTTVEETPAILAAIMFVDNHVGGSYYPAGSTLFLTGKLEKVIEENGGDMLLQQEAVRLIFEGGKPAGVEVAGGGRYYAGHIVYSGTVWNLYKNLIPPEHLKDERARWAEGLVPTYPSVVLYALVDRQVIPADTLPVEMLVGNPEQIDESEVTVYIPSIDDRTLCGSGGHVVIAIGPSFREWRRDGAEYPGMKEEEKQRLFGVLERRFPGFAQAVRFAEVATPATIERYTLKKGGAVAGPKQMLGQHMFHRLRTRSEWDSLFCCGESTVMGTGTPAVTVSGLSAANAVLKKVGLPPFVYRENMKNYVTLVEKPFEPEDLYTGYPESTGEVMAEAARCQFCQDPPCMQGLDLDIRGIMRRCFVGNLAGAKKLALAFPGEGLAASEERCIQKVLSGRPVAIRAVVAHVRGACQNQEKEE